MDLSAEQEKYLIRMRGPDDIFQFIVRDLASVTNISNAAILYDDTFVMTHHYKNLLLNLPVRHLINKLVTGDMKMVKEQITIAMMVIMLSRWSTLGKLRVGEC